MSCWLPNRERGKKERRSRNWSRRERKEEEEEIEEEEEERGGGGERRRDHISTLDYCTKQQRRDVTKESAAIFELAELPLCKL